MWSSDRATSVDLWRKAIPQHREPAPDGDPIHGVDGSSRLALPGMRRLKGGVSSGLAVVLVACGPTTGPGQRSPASGASSVAPTVLPTNTEVTESARLGRHALEVPIGGTALGDVDARDDGDGGVSITVSLADPTGTYPWGIYDQDRCEPPAVNHEAPWQFPDIEGGNHTERVERSVYLSFPGR